MAWQVRDALQSSWRHPNVFPYQANGWQKSDLSRKAMEITTQSSVLLRQHFAQLGLSVKLAAE